MDVIAFCCELVSRAWFDVVEFAFGEVGHTHNGEDAAHHVLNQNVGCYVALTLGEHVLNYEKVWDDPRTRPEAVLVQDQYDWKQRYAPREVVQRIAGFTKTKLDPEVVHAFQVRRSQTGAVEVVWKKRAADTTWLGHDGQPAMQADGRGSTGFMCLKKVPTQPLDLAPWNNQLVDKRYIPELRGPAMSVLCSESYMDGHAQQWILDTIEKGRVEAHSVVEEAIPSAWGPKIKVGAQNKLATMTQLQPINDSADFWALPPEILSRDRLAVAGTAAADMQHDLMPTIGYAHIPPAQRPTASIRRAQEHALRASEVENSTVASPCTQPPSSRKRSKSLAQSLTQTDTTADAAAEEQGEDGEEVEPHPLGNYLGEQDEEQYQPREHSFKVNHFYLVRLGMDADQPWSLCRVVDKPELRHDENCSSAGLWMVKVMWWTKTGNSKDRFIPEKRKKDEAADKSGNDWTYCAAFDGEIKLTHVGGSAWKLTKDSAKTLESTVKQWYMDEGRKPPRYILASSRDQNESASDDDAGSDSSSDSST